MLALDCPIPEEVWAREATGRNGDSSLRAGPFPKEDVADAGPWEPVVREIISYQDLSDNWDGYGAEVPTRAVLESAIGLAYTYYQNGVDPPGRVAPGVAGSVIFEWQDPDGTYATVEVDAPLHAEVMVIESGKPAQQWTLPTRTSPQGSDRG
jgi:hypothetical protein